MWYVKLTLHLKSVSKVTLYEDIKALARDCSLSVAACFEISNWITDSYVFTLGENNNVETITFGFFKDSKILDDKMFKHYTERSAGLLSNDLPVVAHVDYTLYSLKS